MPAGGCELRVQQNVAEGTSIVIIARDSAVTSLAGAVWRASCGRQHRLQWAVFHTTRMMMGY